MEPPKPYLANLAIILALSGWLVYAFGSLLQMGDPSPMLTSAEIAKLHTPAKLISVVGILSILSSVWLSGFTFNSARKRSCVALMLAMLPSIIFIYVYIANGV